MKKIVIKQGLSDSPAAVEIRKAVFIDEQGFQNEFDETDDTAYHAVMTINDEPAAVGRLYCDADGNYHIGRIAVLKQFRGMGLGREIVSALETVAADLNADEVQLSAQVRAKKFYEKLGYSEEGSEYFDEFCPHILMKKRLK